jgi:hypothetical protein
MERRRRLERSFDCTYRMAWKGGGGWKEVLTALTGFTRKIWTSMGLGIMAAIDWLFGTELKAKYGEAWERFFSDESFMGFLTDVEEKWRSTVKWVETTIDSIVGGVRGFFGKVRDIMDAFSIKAPDWIPIIGGKEWKPFESAAAGRGRKEDEIRAMAKAGKVTEATELATQMRKNIRNQIYSASGDQKQKLQYDMEQAQKLEKFLRELMRKQGPKSRNDIRIQNNSQVAADLYNAKTPEYVHDPQLAIENMQFFTGGG